MARETDTFLPQHVDKQGRSKRRGLTHKYILNDDGIHIGKTN